MGSWSLSAAAALAVAGAVGIGLLLRPPGGAPVAPAGSGAGEGPSLASAVAPYAGILEWQSPTAFLLEAPVSGPTEAGRGQ